MMNEVKNTKNNQEHIRSTDQQKLDTKNIDLDSLYRVLIKVDTDFFFDLLSENYSAG